MKRDAPGEQPGGDAGARAPPQAGRGLVLQFRVTFMTVWGESLRVVGEGALLGNWDAAHGQQMVCRHAGEELVWEARVLLPVAGRLQYRYVVVDEAGEVKTEEPEPRLLDVSEALREGGTVQICDTWQDAAHPAALLSRSAFSEVILAHKTRVEERRPRTPALAPGDVLLSLQCWSWGLQDGEEVVAVGSLPSLGSWKADAAAALTETTTPHWELQLAVPAGAFPVRYKFGVRSGRGEVELEAGEARVAELAAGPAEEPGAASEPPAEPPAALVRSDGPLAARTAWRGAGVAVPVFSLRSASSVGAGEFVDIRPLVDLCAATGIRLIQLLPINDTCVHNSWWDSYPYSSVSVYALHPLYLSMDALSDAIPADLKQRIVEARRKLDQPAVDYEATLAAKLGIAREVFERGDDALLQTAGFKAWYADNEHWLRPYAVFGVLRDLFGTSEHWRWGALAQPTPELLERLSSPSRDHHRRLQFVHYLQYQLHRQLLAVSNYAEGHRIALKGDLPIGVSKGSVDTWVDTRLFHMAFSTGAPPDYFDRNGQNWGFPTYNWTEMRKDGYAWWRARLAHMAQYFHAYRIDHILGFFRIWEIPGDCVTGLLGHFRPSFPATRASLAAAGLWDVDRLTQPWITPRILRTALGDLAEDAASRFLTEHLPGRFLLRPAYNSEERIAAIAAKEGSPAWLVEETARIRSALQDLSQNVLLLPVADDPDAFTPRIGLADTSSFADLEPGWQAHLRWLHDDYFYARHNQLWSRQALESLPALMKATDMLVCGEDLGMVPDCVHPVLRRLGLLGLRIQRMPSGAGEFGDPATYPYLTVASPSCHDTSTSRAWFEADEARRQRFCTQALKLRGPLPARCTPAVMAAIVKQHLDSPAMWAIFPIQDLLALSPLYCQRPAAEETINDPTNPRHYWRFRVHVPLEQLLADDRWLGDLQALLLASQRTTEEELPLHHAAGNHTG